MKIKRIHWIILSFLLFAGYIQGFSANRAIERIYLSTDRNTYLAGEAIWVSLYCFDISDKIFAFSNLSSVAYIELHNTSGVVLTVKVALKQGRGSGKIDIPLVLPTGNYRMIAYTKQMRNEEHFCYFEKIVTIYNTLSSERAIDNVVFTIDTTKHVVASVKEQLSSAVTLTFEKASEVLAKNTPYYLTMNNITEHAVYCNLSVKRLDLEKTTKTTLPLFLSSITEEKSVVKFVGNHIPDYEGEVIAGEIHNLPKDAVLSSVFLSVVGNDTEVYVSPVDPKSGEIRFYTGGIYGNREVALEYISETPQNNIRIDLLDPFARPKTRALPKLYMNKSLTPELLARSMEMQVNQRFNEYVLTSIPVPNDPLLSIKPAVYKLDNYTRFPDMKEVIIEFISELRFRKANDKNILQIAIKNDISAIFSRNPCMVLVDGILLFDHDRILDYDPLKVESITIYQQKFRIGNHNFDGLVKFSTYKGDYQGLVLNKNVNIQEYQGMSYPCRFTGREVATNKDLPDLRSLLYWDPLMDLKAKERREVMIYTSSVPGRYVVTIEGVSVIGEPIYQQQEFIVE